VTDRNLGRRIAAGIVRRIANPANRALQRLESARVSETQRRREEESVAKIERTLGKLDEATRKRIRSYSIEVLGSESYWTELAAYTLVAGGFREGWIPNSYCWNVVAPVASGHLRTLSSMKSVTRLCLPDAPLPDVGYYANGVFCDHTRSAVSLSQFEQTVLSHHTRVIFKADGAGQGEAIQVFNRDGFDPVLLKKFGSGVFQRFLCQHETLETISPGPVATIRIYSWLDDSGKISLRGGYLRVGRRKQEYIRASETIRCALNLNEGQLVGIGYGSNFQPYERHPDTEVIFDGYPIPQLEAAMSMAMTVHKDFSLVRLIGWDFAVEKDNSLALLEWNIRPSIAFVEPACGPNFADLGWENYWREPKAG
jgi:hypothetical protein